MHKTSPFDGTAHAAQRHRSVGRWVVVGLFTFAAVLTAIDWIYWKLHVSPFLPLQKKLADRWPGSQPRVEGGRHKMHKPTPTILRVTMKIDFNPTTAHGRHSAQEFSQTVADFVAREYDDLSRYEYLELHFYWPDPEKEIRQASITYKVRDLPAR